ncbi:uncharacterized protein LOC130069502 [Rhinichthys klamathensis goyatoka]|uniref:uncharacterized protein LOC130069502 n=1 Tax=Rhinichthys klamathensis goyatoka TaxID=3034132 RepID=UPI0024B4B4BC|nr:uncharacterized protein LOC130069502 [Rhinichthys klamathensis goyatoka]
MVASYSRYPTTMVCLFLILLGIYQESQALWTPRVQEITRNATLKSGQHFTLPFISKWGLWDWVPRNDKDLAKYRKDVFGGCNFYHQCYKSRVIWPVKDGGYTGSAQRREICSKEQCEVIGLNLITSTNVEINLVLNRTHMLTIWDSLTQGCIYPIVLPCEGFLRDASSRTTRFKGNYVRVWHSEDENEYCETELETGEIGRCFYLSAVKSNKAQTCPNTTIAPAHGILLAKETKTLINEAHMVRQRINYNLNSLLTVFDQSYCGNFTQIRSWLDKEVKYYTSKNPLSSKNRKTRSIWGDIAGVFGSVNSISNTAQMNQLSKYTQWVGTMSGKGLTEALQGSLHIIAAGQHLNDAAKELADALTKSSNFETHRAACLFLAQNLKDQMVEDIQVIRMGQVPERIAESLLVVFGNQLNLTSAKHIPLVKIAINENSLSGSGMLPLIMIWPQYGKRNVMTVRQFQSMGVRQGNSVIRLGRNGYWADGDTPMISTTDCCVEEHEWVICSCSTMFSLSLNGSAVWEVVPLDQATGAWQVSEAQWCILHDGISENMIYGGKLCPIPPDPFCLEILYPLHLGGIHVPHVQLLQIEPQWWNNDLVEERNYELFEMVRRVKKSVKAAQEEGIQAMGHVIVANGVAKLMSERKLPRILGNLSWSDWIVLTMVGVSVFMLIIQVLICVTRRKSTKPVKLIISNQMDRTKNGTYSVK